MLDLAAYVYGNLESGQGVECDCSTSFGHNLTYSAAPLRCYDDMPFYSVQSVSKDANFSKEAVWLWDGEREHGLCDISNTLLAVW